MMKLRPLWDDVIVEVIPIKQKKNIVTITIPTEYHDKYFDQKCWLGKVKVVGPGYQHNGKFITPTINKDDYVLFPSWSSNLLKAYSTDTVVVRERDVYAIVDKNDINKLHLPHQRPYYTDSELDERTLAYQKQQGGRKEWQPEK